MKLIINTLVIASAIISGLLFGLFIDLYWLIDPEKASGLLVKVMEWTKK